MRTELVQGLKRRKAGDSCTSSSRRCADARDYKSILRPCCRAHVVHLSQIAAETLTEAGVPFWADYGTLLGAVRNPRTTRADYPWLSQEQLPDGPIAPGIVPHDKDSDWGLHMEDWRAAFAALERRLKKDPLRMKRARLDLLVRRQSGSMKLRLSLFNHTNLDLFFWNTVPAKEKVKLDRFGATVQLGPDMMYRMKYAQVDKYKGKEFHRDTLLPLSAVTWEGMTLSAPHDPEAFLEMRYGPGWRTPVAANNDGMRR